MFFDGMASKMKPGNLCLGLDPELLHMGAFFDSEHRKLGTKDFLVALGSTALEAAAPLVSAVKLQSAYYEQFGGVGWQAMKETIAHAHQLNLPVIFDAKRGDISSTMSAYGRAAFDELGADAMTVTAWMGFDVLAPMRPWVQSGRGLYVVWSTSNPGAALLQDDKLLSAQTVADRMMEILDARIEEEGLTNGVGWVLGATRVDRISRMLTHGGCRRCWLLPGVGAQGAPVSEDLKALVRGSPASLVPLSRGLIDFKAHHESWKAFARSVAERSRHWQKQLL